MDKISILKIVKLIKNEISNLDGKKEIVVCNSIEKCGYDINSEFSLTSKIDVVVPIREDDEEDRDYHIIHIRVKSHMIHPFDLDDINQIMRHLGFILVNICIDSEIGHELNLKLVYTLR